MGQQMTPVEAREWFKEILVKVGIPESEMKAQAELMREAYDAGVIFPSFREIRELIDLILEGSEQE